MSAQCTSKVKIEAKTEVHDARAKVCWCGLPQKVFLHDNDG